MSEYELRNGINYRRDGYVFCNRCGRRPIVKDKCLYCDVQVTDEDRRVAHELNDNCFYPSRGRQPGFVDARPEFFDEETAARILAAERT